MKRNRFQEMIPPVPEDFHGAVVDALNRMERAERGHRAYMARMSAYAAAAAALVLVVCLAVMMPKRLPKEDVVTAPNESEMIVRPTEEPEQVRMEIGEWQVFDDGNLELKWTMTATDEEALLICGNARTVFENGAPPDGFDGFNMIDGYGDPDYLQIGRSLLGDGNGTVIRHTGRSHWSNKGMPMALVIHVDVYRPTAELIASNWLGPEYFENKPAWWVDGNGVMGDVAGERCAMPVDWYDASYQTPVGSKLVSDTLRDFQNSRSEQIVSTKEDTLKFLQEEGALRTALLEGYDFGEHVKSFDFIVDLTDGSGVGALEIVE